jgi:hypothetical protein
MTPQPPKPKTTTTIHIDKAQFKVAEDALTGAQLRALPSPPIGADFDLYLEIRGPGDDRLVTDADSIALENGMQFFTAPSTIAPGRAA